MGLDSDSLLWDILKQSFFFLAVALLFFMIVAAADPKAFWMEYYAQDLGLTVSALHGARGDVELQYAKLPRRGFDYQLAEQTLLVRPTGNEVWSIPKVFGGAAGTPVVPTLLTQPSIVDFGKGEQITMEEGAGPRDACPPFTPLEKGQTNLEVSGDSPLLDSLADVAARYAVAPAANQLRFVLQTGSATTLSTTGDVELSAGWACHFAKELNLEVTGEENPAALPGDPTLILTHTMPPSPALEARLNIALAKSLAKVLQ